MRCTIIFMLSENVLKSCELGIIGHIQQMDDIPEGTFFIADSLKRVILGPFVVTQTQYYSSEPIQFYRSVPEPVLVDCHWLLRFEPHPGAGKAETGLLWEALADYIEMPRSAWKNIRQVKFTNDQIRLIFETMVLANSQPFINGTVSLDDLYRKDDDWDRFVDGLDDGNYHDEEAYYTSYQGIVDLLFNGDYAMAEANLPDD